jgi:serine/threonine protein kinase/WD40 repeat protein
VERVIEMGDSEEDLDREFEELLRSDTVAHNRFAACRQAEAAIREWADHASRVGALHPDAIAGYELISCLGEGGQGAVYEAKDLTLGRRVALKVLRFRPLDEDRDLQRFHDEVRAHARLQHRGIVPVFSSGTQGDLPFYTMQFIDGASLHDVVEEVKRRLQGRVLPPTPGEASRSDTRPIGAAKLLLGEINDGARPTLHQHYFDVVARLGGEVAEALAYAHGEGILHRDIKPSNLLLDEHGAIWLADFGLAKFEGADSLTKSGDILGTLPYMAPERFQGWSDRRSDIYSLGLTLYELLTLERAFDSLDRSRLIRMVLNDEPLPPRKLNRRIPRDLEAIVLKAIEKEPSRRFQTAKDLAEDLARYRKREPTRTRPITVPGRAWKWCRRKPMAASLVAAVFVALIAGVLFTWKWQQARTMSESAEWGTLYDRARDAIRARRSGLRHEVRQALLTAHAIRPDPRLTTEAIESLACWDAVKVPLEGVPEPTRRWGHLWFLALSPDGSLVAAGGEDKPVLWHLPSGHRVPSSGSIPSSHGPGASVAFSAGGELLALGTASKGISIWDVSDLDRVHHKTTIPEPHQAIRMEWHPTEPKLACVLELDGSSPQVESPVRRRAKIWDLTGGSPRMEPPMEWDSGDLAVFCLSFDPEGKRIALGLADGAVHIHETSGMKQQFVLRSDRRDTFALAWHPKGKLLAAGSNDGSVTVWDLELEQRLSNWIAHKHGVQGLAFSASGEWLASAGWNGVPSLWDPVSGVRVLRVDANLGGQHGRSLSLSRDAGYFAVAGEWSIGVCRLLPPSRGLWRRQTTSTEVQKIAFSPDGENFVTLFQDSVLRVWATETGDEQALLRTDVSKFIDNSDVRFSDDGQLLAVTIHEGRTDLWDWRKSGSQHVWTWSAPRWGLCPRLRFKDDGTLVLVRHEEPLNGKPWVIAVYGLERGSKTPRVIGTYETTGAKVFDSCLAPQLGSLYTWLGPTEPDTERRLRLFDTETVTELDAQSLPGLRPLTKDTAASVHSNEKGDRLVTGGFKFTERGTTWDPVELFQVEDGKLKRVDQWDGPAKGPLSPDADWMLLWEQGDVSLWDIRSRQLIATLPVRAGAATASAISPDGSWVVCGTDGGAVLAFELETIRAALKDMSPGLAW